MNKLLALLLSLCLIQSCKQAEFSDIEVIKFDPKVIDTLKAIKDTFYTEFIGDDDFYTRDVYLTYKDSAQAIVLKDSSGNIVAFRKTQYGKNTFVAEYYSNGQIIGKTEFKPGTVDGPATYYYPDGRIKSKGIWKDYKQVGTWKKYREDGKLVEIVHYNEAGQEIKVDSMN